VRASNTEKDSPFTISKVNKKGKINHQRIRKRADGTFELTVMKSSHDKSKTITSHDDLLATFIRSISGELGLDNACPGSPFRSIFSVTKSEGYLDKDQE